MLPCTELVEEETRLPLILEKMQSAPAGLDKDLSSSFSAQESSLYSTSRDEEEEEEGVAMETSVTPVPGAAEEGFVVSEGRVQADGAETETRESPGLYFLSKMR